MNNKKIEVFKEFINREYPNNLSFPVDNIIVGLFKNMLRKIPVAEKKVLGYMIKISMKLN